MTNQLYWTLAVAIARGDDAAYAAMLDALMEEGATRVSAEYEVLGFVLKRTAPPDELASWCASNESAVAHYADGYMPF